MSIAETSYKKTMGTSSISLRWPRVRALARRALERRRALTEGGIDSQVDPTVADDAPDEFHDRPAGGSVRPQRHREWQPALRNPGRCGCTAGAAQQRR
jgi:hypothetical protein